VKYTTLIFCAVFLFFGLVAKAQAATYYVDNCDVTGNDTNNGTSVSTPWLTVNKINTSSFVAGDSILFRKGCVWREALTIPSSGSSGNNIIFGAYGSGANPVLNGSAVLNNSNFSPYSLGAPTIYGYTPTTNITDNATRNYRQIIASVNAASPTIQIKLTAADSANLVIGGVSIGVRSSGNVASSLTRVTWNGGSSGVTITAGTSQTSDIITFPVTTGQSYLVHIYITSRNIKDSGPAGVSTYYDSNSADETMIVTPNGSQLTTTLNNQNYVTAILGAAQTIWSTTQVPTYPITSITSSGTTATVTTPSPHGLDPAHYEYVIISGASPAGYDGAAQINVTGPTTFTYIVSSGLLSPSTGTAVYSIPVSEVWENNVYLKKQISAAACSVAGSYYWDGTTLYVNGWNQNNPSTNGKTYEVPHHTYGIFDNRKNYLDISNIDTIQSYGSSDANGNITGNWMSGIFLVGHNNTVHDLATWNNSRHNFSFYAYGGMPGSTNNRGYNLTIHDSSVTTPITFYGNATADTTTGNILENSTIYNSEAYTVNDGLIVLHGAASSNIVQNNNLYYTNNNTHQAINSYDTGTDSNIIRWNNFSGLTGPAIFLNSSGGNGSPANDQIYGNVIQAGSASNDSISFQNTGGHVVYNNTIISPTNASYSAIHLINSPNVTVKNNIIYGPYAIRVHDVASETGFVSNYNDFYNTGSLNWTWGSGTSYTTLSTWQSASSNDANSTSSNPLFVGSGNNPYSLQSDSPVINVGVSLGDTYKLELSPSSTWSSSVTTLDQTQNGSGWDIGAYIYPEAALVVATVATPTQTPTPSGHRQDISNLLSTTTPLQNKIVPPISNPNNFTHNLSLYATGEDVHSLQQFLNTHGFIVAPTGAGSSGQETTLFGLLTYKALVKFQKSVGLPATGWFGPMTREVIRGMK